MVALATKSDRVDRDRLAEHLIAIDQLGDWDAIVPCSAVSGEQVEVVAEVLASYLPSSPGPLYPEGVLTDEPEAMMIAELMREAALEGVRDELPHSLAVVVEEMVPARAGPPTGRCSTCGSARLRRAPVAEGDHRSQRLAAARVGSSAPGIEALLGQKVFLDLREGRQGLAARPEAAAAASYGRAGTFGTDGGAAHRRLGALLKAGRPGGDAVTAEDVANQHDGGVQAPRAS